MRIAFVAALLVAPFTGCAAAPDDCRPLEFWSHLEHVRPGESVSIHVSLRNCGSETLTLPANACRTEETFLPRVILFGEEYWLDRNETAVPPSWPCPQGWPTPQPIVLGPGEVTSANVVWDGRYRNATAEPALPAPAGPHLLVARAGGGVASSSIEVLR